MFMASSAVQHVERMAVIIGYSRTSTTEQIAGLEAQDRELKAAGAERIFTEQVSSVALREALDEAIDYAREGDVLCVTKLDRLARSVAHLCELVTRLQAKSVALRILNMNIDTGTPTGKLMLNLLGAIAEFERGVMLERQREGIAKAKSDGKYKGRAPLARAKTELVLQMVRVGKTRHAVATELNISVRSVFRILREHRVSKKVPVESAA
jgi:DNA invertase Pin-like site-specific DNA recombinase